MNKLFLTLLLGAALSAKMINGVAVVVTDKPITLYDIKEEMKLTKADERRATNMLIRQKLESIEIEKRHIAVTSSEVYDDIKKTAAANNMSINQFYEAVREANGLSSSELKEKIKHKLQSQQLYMAIAYKNMEEPSEEEIKAYYELHKNTLSHPNSFTTTIYISQDKELLTKKSTNPMFYSPDIQENEQILEYNKLAPELAQLLAKTPIGSFTPVLPNGRGGFMSFYIKNVAAGKTATLSSMRNQIVNAMMGDKREQVLSDYFARLVNSDNVKHIRMLSSLN